MIRRHTRALLAIPILLLPLACSDGPTRPAPVVATIQLTPAVSELPDGGEVQFRATLLDQNGTPFTVTPAGVMVEWASSNDSIASVGLGGKVTANRPGAVRITASAAGQSASVDLSVTQVATRLEPTDGDTQVGMPGAALAEALTVRVTDRHGDPVPGMSVDWAVVAGGGVIEPVAAATDAEGYAFARWTLGEEDDGVHTAEASVEGLVGSPAVFTASTHPIAYDLTGAWELTVDGICAGSIEVEQSGTTFEVSGSIGGGFCPFAASGAGEGELTGDQISFGIGFGSGSDAGGSGLGAITFTGTVVPGAQRMSGTYSGSRSGSWVAQRRTATQ
jgi:hypothetical protein